MKNELAENIHAELTVHEELLPIHEELRPNAEEDASAPSLATPKKKKKKGKGKWWWKRKKSKLPSDPVLFTIPDEALVPYVMNLQLRLSEGKLRGLLPYLSQFFTEEQLQQAIRLYRLGCVHKDCVMFPFFDIEGRLRVMRVIKYDDMGKRKRNGVSSAHMFLKEDGLIPPQWKERSCLFGEHLLAKNPERPVVIVEGEKTALLCSMLLPEFLWLATGGCGYFKEVGMVKEYLNSRTTYILPDKGQYDFWVKEARRFQVKGRVLDFIEKMEVEQNSDIADLLLSDEREAYLKDFVECLSTDK